MELTNAQRHRIRQNTPEAEDEARMLDMMAEYRLGPKVMTKQDEMDRDEAEHDKCE